MTWLAMPLPTLIGATGATLLGVRLRAAVKDRLARLPTSYSDASIRAQCLPQFDVAAEIASANRFTSDFYHLLTMPGNSCAILTGTTSGRGIPAASLESVIHVVVPSRRWKESHPDHEA